MKKRLDYFYFNKGYLTLSIRGTHFVVSGEILRDIATNLFYDPHLNESFQLVSGERVSALSYGVFGTYPNNLEHHSQWIEKAIYASLIFAGTGDIKLSIDEMIAMLEWLESRGWNVDGFGALNLLREERNDNQNMSR